MENDNARRFMQGSINYFRWLGFEIEPTKWWRIFLLAGTLLEMTLFAAGQGIDIALSGKDLQEKAEVISFFSYFLVAIGKLVPLVFKRRELHAMVVELRRLYPSKRVEEDYRLQIYLKWYLRLDRILFWFFFGTTFSYTAIPLIGLIVRVCRGHEFVYKTPLSIWNPIKIPHTWYVFIFSFAIQVHSSYKAGLTILAADLCLFSSVMQLCMHFDVISRNILQIEPGVSEQAEARLREQIIYHQSVLELATKINSIFTPSILFSLFSSSVILCFTGYQLLWDVTIGIVLRLVALLVYELKQVTITCFLGDRLMEKSSGVSDAIYEHKWYNGTKKYKKMVLIAMTRAQQTVALNIAGITEVSKQTLRQVISISYKVFAVLKTQTV